MKRFTVAGHVAVDKIITDEGAFHQLGGPPCFAASLSRTLGFELETVTRRGDDFPEEYTATLDRLGLSTKKTTGSQSTRFVIDYRYSPRRIRLPTICEPIRLNELANIERLLLCPIAGEISDHVMKEVDSSFLGLDPQGLLRKVGPEYIIESQKWWNPEVVKKLDLLKISSNEHHLITGTTDIKQSLKKLVENGVKTAVITDGENGSFVMTGSKLLHIPIFPVDVVDSTGAGDVFAAALAAYIDEGLSWACAMASASSSAIVETHGIEIKQSKSEIIRRAECIQDKIVSSE